ncbi:bh protein [Irregularibacter muris]|uniref:Bh protein n=1 Tax=Irregularibacter muris TaxID=1796619 RepID=A0AAE3L2J6_9FIRM|nr:bh protein [Irregularibacter muris]MCR1898694.1 bh protein [Irregularibacter muris]
MANSKLNAMLFCLHCDEDTQHTIIYKQNKIESIQCEKCGVAIMVDHEYVQQHYKEEIIERVLSKPSRMTKEMEADIGVFFSRLPYRVISKPYRLIKEFYHQKHD